jgi:hypothetical protein
MARDYSQIVNAARAGGRMSSEARGSAASGFQGAVGNLPLVDLLQVWALNRFSGLITVQSEGRAGHLYLVEGEIVHAEADELSGEPAVRVILGWPEGQFDLAPNTATLKRTIQKSVSHLLLDVHRQLDEGRAGRAPSGASPPAARPAKEPSVRGPLDQIRAIRGVRRVVRAGNDGTPSGAGGPEAEALAAAGVYLDLAPAAAVRAAFGLRELAVATVENERQALVVVRGATGFLCVEVEPGSPLELVVAAVRSILSRAASR